MAGGHHQNIVESTKGGIIQTSAAGQDLSQRSGMNRQMADFGISSQPTHNQAKLKNFNGFNQPPKSMVEFGGNIDDGRTEYSCASMLTHS